MVGSEKENVKRIWSWSICSCMTLFFESSWSILLCCCCSTDQLCFDVVHLCHLSVFRAQNSQIAHASNSKSILCLSFQEYTVNLYVRQTWRDFRLAFTETNRTVTLNYNQLSRIWVPDLFFRNEKRAVNHDVTVPNRLLRLSPDGTVLYSQRYGLFFIVAKKWWSYSKCRWKAPHNLVFHS